MSSCKGNVKRIRPQKYQNRTSFKNDLHDTSTKTKFINTIQPTGVCQRCKEILEWKIKYKKYKPLTAPKKCVRCEQRSIKHAYHIMCLSCARKEGVCSKCCQKNEIIETNMNNSPTEDGELQQIIKSLPERKRRTLLRYLYKKKKLCKNEDKSKNENDENYKSDNENDEMELMNKINKIKLDAMKNNSDDDENFNNDFDSDVCDEDSEDEISE